MRFKEVIKRMEEVDKRWADKSIEMALQWLKDSNDITSLYAALGDSMPVMYVWVEIYNNLCRRGDIVRVIELSEEDYKDLSDEVTRLFKVTQGIRFQMLCRALYAIVVIDEMNKK